MKLKILLSVFIAILFLSTKSYVYSQNVSVTASVNPDASDLQFDFEALTAQEIFPQNSTIEYQLTYGSEAFTPIPITLVAKWEEGTIENTMSTFGVINYVDGSATNAYGNTPPVIDLINNRITWTLTSFPGPTSDETVKYSVRTNNIYKGSSLVNFLNKAKLTSVSLELPEISVGKKYLYEPSLEPASTPTPTPNQSSQQSENITNTPAPAVNNLTPTLPIKNLVDTRPKFTQISLRSVTANKLQIYIESNSSSSYRLYYGNDRGRLDQMIENQNYTENSELAIDNLYPDTGYYIRAEGRTRSGSIFRSDIYIFKTAELSELPTILENTIIISSANGILSDFLNINSAEKYSIPVIVLPINQVFEFKFSLDKRMSAKRVQIFIRNKNVLGISTSATPENTEKIMIVDAIEVAPGIYAGSLGAAMTPGNYEVIARIYDYSGNIVEQKLADLRVSKRMKVINSETKKPVEGARVLLNYFNQKKGAYEVLPAQIFQFKNPIFTNINGEIEVTLAQGKYLAEVSAIGYESKQTEFVIGLNPNEDYPEIIIREEKFNIFAAIRHYWSIMKDFVSETNKYIQNLSNSNRFFEFNALITLGILIILTIYSFLSKFNIPIGSFFAYISHHTKTAMGDAGSRKIVRYKLYDNVVKQEISGADVYLIDKNKNKVLSHIKTDSRGEFRLGLIRVREYLIEIMKDGYQPLIYNLEYDNLDTDHPSTIFYNDKISINKVVKSLKQELKNFAGFIFEILLAVSLIFEISLGISLGWSKALPFIVISVINIFIWIVILYSRRVLYR